MKVYGYTLKTYLEYLKENNKILSPKEYLSIAITLSKTLKDLHKNEVYHTDLKLSNVLLDNFDNIVLSDFGCVSEHNVLPKGFLGNVKTKSPESFYEERPYSLDKHDVFSLGIIFNQIVTGDISIGNNKPRIASNNAYTDYVFIDFLIDEMLNQDPQQRPNMERVNQFLTLYYKMVFHFDKNFMKFKKNEPINQFSRYYKNMDIYRSSDGRKFYRKKFEFNINYIIETLKRRKIKFIEITDATNYKNGELNIMKNSFIFESSYSNNIKDIVFFEFDNILICINEYKTTQKKELFFFYKNIVDEHLDFFMPLTSSSKKQILYSNYFTHNDLYSDEILLIEHFYKKIKNCSINFIILYDKEQTREHPKEIILSNYIEDHSYVVPSRIRVFFEIDDLIFPLPLTKNLDHYLKKELNLK